MTTLEITKDTLKVLGYKYDRQVGWRISDELVSRNEGAKLIASRIRNHLEKIKSEQKPSIENIINAIELLKADEYKTYEIECYENIKYNPAAKDKFEELAKLISGENYNPIYPHILRQVIYSIKRKMLGKKVICPIFAIFYGDGGTGKTTLVDSLCALLPQHQCAPSKQADKLVNSEKHTQMLMDNLVIHLGEVSGLTKASLENLKNIVDMEYVAYVPLYVNGTTRGLVKATLIGTSNHLVKNVLISTDVNRKWVQVDFYSREGRDETYCQARRMEIENFDYKSIWQSIDEDGPEPLGNVEIYTDYLKYLSETCRSSSPTTDFLDAIIDEKAGEWIGRIELYNHYKTALRDETDSRAMRKDLFYETCEKRGLRFKRKSGIGTFGYDIPKKKDGDTLDIAKHNTSLDESADAIPQMKIPSKKSRDNAERIKQMTAGDDIINEFLRLDGGF